MRTGSAALSLSSPRAFFAFLFTERLSATISEPGTGYFRLGNLVSSLKNWVKKPWKVRLPIEVEPCVIFISFYFRSWHQRSVMSISPAGGEVGAYFFCLEETGVGGKSWKIDGIVSTVLSGVVARKILAIFATFADFSGPFLAFSLSKSWILLHLLFLRFLWQM